MTNFERYKADRIASIAWTIDQQVIEIADYLEASQIKRVTLGLSGGADSTLALAMLIEANKRLRDPVLIDGMFFTHTVHRNAVDWGTMNNSIRPMRDNFMLTQLEVDLDGIVAAVSAAIGDHSKEVAAQVAYQQMYSCMFANAQAWGGITVGTTNLDELGFVGWFGKTSDMMVDIQFLHNMHKFEVFAALKYLGIPITEHMAQPKGDLLTGETDEQAFGCSYDVVSYVTACMLDLLPNYHEDDLRAAFPSVFDLHEKNGHKYQGQKFNPIFLGEPLRIYQR